MDFNKLEKFNTVDDIPDIPIIKDKEEYENYIVKNLIRCGAIPKEELQVGVTYEGSCRNSTEATWDGEKFVYNRHKFGICYVDEVNHFQDDDGYDLFVPIRIKKEE